MNSDIKNKTHRSTIVQSFLRFTKIEASSGILLLLATGIAIFWANSPWSETYFGIWKTHMTIGFSDFVLSKPLLLWINDGLMALFFFVVGLEIKREIISGELSSLKKAVLPVFAAIGGMVVPAIIYAAFNISEPSAKGWGIPMATDIAFSLGILAMLGTRVPLSLKIFLTALAIADDLGAVIVIALFYSSDISLQNLLLGAIFLVVMLIGNFTGIRNKWFYAMVGIAGLWLAFLLSGVHATVAGILGALTIPARTRIHPEEYSQRIRSLMDKYHEVFNQKSKMPSHEQLSVIATVKENTKNAETPLQSLEHTIHPWITFLVMPIFALANAGIILSPEAIPVATHPVSIGVLLGLLVGKAAGITFFSFIPYKLGFASLPEKIKWAHIVGLGFIAGIGFTMSLFISGLAFRNDEYLLASKIGLLLGSLVSGIIGFVILKISLKPSDE
ncbi:Na+/H+ antiporter NhaA [Fulvivirgaceae bacterium BMA10]|uniref:Na(+)/H(+) antiporter NhaA n=1 Tax=Splendidivirga corallicola TaxID=3051826 RepID=A0ABT8KGB3_9BACT|nr:Na+/H+ antiporter NhaA [Fulvivirgaceae bacterium BMA10]